MRKTKVITGNAYDVADDLTADWFHVILCSPPTIVTTFEGPGGKMATEMMHPKGMIELDAIHCSLIVASAARALADCYGLPLDDILDKAKEVCMNPRAHILQDSGRMTMEAMDLEEVDEEDEDDE